LRAAELNPVHHIGGQKRKRISKRAHVNLAASGPEIAQRILVPQQLAMATPGRIRVI
jgi:hypothetical protein